MWLRRTVATQMTCVQQLVESYVDHDAWLRQKVASRLGRLDRGEFLTHEEVGAKLEKMFRL
jgi:predicted transcriptional regulator